jgi:hypothetical protein
MMGRRCVGRFDDVEGAGKGRMMVERVGRVVGEVL